MKMEQVCKKKKKNMTQILVILKNGVFKKSGLKKNKIK